MGRLISTMHCMAYILKLRMLSLVRYLISKTNL